MASIIQKLQKKPRPQKKRGEEKTLPIKDHPAEPEPAAPSYNNIPIEPAQMQTGCGQSVGMQRDHNEDSLFTLNTNFAAGNRQIPFGLYMIADGMGGQQHGEIASNTAVRVVSRAIIRRLYLPLFGPEEQLPDTSLQEIVLDAVKEAHHAILRAAPGGGTTFTSMLIVGEQMAIAHVGDSRLYLVNPDQTIETLTRDHSLTKRLEELGQITAEEAKTHPQRNVLYRALGQGEPFDPDMILMQVPRSAWLVICSDGLWGLVSPESIVAVLQLGLSPDAACSRLVQMANEAGGPDNISVIAVHMPA